SSTQPTSRAASSPGRPPACRCNMPATPGRRSSSSSRKRRPIPMPKRQWFSLHRDGDSGQNLRNMLRRPLLLLVLVLAPLGSGAARAVACPTGATTAAFLAPGPFAVGVRSLTLVDTTRQTPAHAGFPALPSRTLPTQVWYPTTGPAGAAPVPDA